MIQRDTIDAILADARDARPSEADQWRAYERAKRRLQAIVHPSAPEYEGMLRQIVEALGV